MNYDIMVHAELLVMDGSIFYKYIFYTLYDVNYDTMLGRSLMDDKEGGEPVRGKLAGSQYYNGKP